MSDQNIAAMQDESIEQATIAKKAEPTVEELKRRIAYLERDSKHDQEHLTRQAKKLRRLRETEAPNRLLAQAEGVLSTVDIDKVPNSERPIFQTLALLVAYLHSAQDIGSYNDEY